MKKVSIVIPIYNMVDSLEGSIEKILKQTYRNIEVIIIDDGSTDKSAEVCRALQNKYDCLQVWSTENRGSGPARNLGIEKSTGDYIYFPDADDLLEANAIEILVKTMQKQQCDLVVFGYKKLYKQKIMLINYPDITLSGNDVRKNYVDFFSMDSKLGIQGAPWNKFFDLRKIKEHGILYPNLRRHQDEVFISRYMQVAEKICFSNNVFYTYYVNDWKKEWEKYPVDYIDIVTELYKYRKSIISAWNPNNANIIRMIQEEYLRNIIKAMELSFNPKFSLNYQQRRKWFLNQIINKNMKNIFEFKDSNDFYQKAVIYCFKKEEVTILYVFLKFKVFLRKLKELVKTICGNLSNWVRCILKKEDLIYASASSKS